MQTEKEFLKEVDNLLGAIRRAPDEKRKDVMRKQLHSKVYPKKHRYGFNSNEEVRNSIDCMKAGRPDPSKNMRYGRLKERINHLTKVIAEWDKERQAEKEPQSFLFTLKLTRLEDSKDNMQEYRETFDDFDRD